MLHDTGMKPFNRPINDTALYILACIAHLLPSWHPATHARHRQTPFPVFLLFFTERLNLWINQYGHWHYWPLRIARMGCIGAKDDDLQVNAN